MIVLFTNINQAFIQLPLLIVWKRKKTWRLSFLLFLEKRGTFDVFFYKTVLIRSVLVKWNLKFYLPLEWEHAQVKPTNKPTRTSQIDPKNSSLNF